MKLLGFTKRVCKFSILTEEIFIPFQRWNGILFLMKIFTEFAWKPPKCKTGQMRLKKKEKKSEVEIFTISVLLDCSTSSCAHGQRTAGSALPPASLTAAHRHQDVAHCSMEQHQVWVPRGMEEVCYLQGVMMHCAGQGANASCVPPCATCQSCLCSLCSLCLPYCLGSVFPGEQPTPLLCRAPWRLSCTCVSGSKMKQLQIVTLIFGNFTGNFCFSSKLKVND